MRIELSNERLPRPMILFKEEFNLLKRNKRSWKKEHKNLWLIMEEIGLLKLRWREIDFNIFNLLLINEDISSYRECSNI